MLNKKKKRETRMIRVSKLSSRLLREIAVLCRRSQISVLEELMVNLHDVVSEYSKANLDFTVGSSKCVICVYGKKCVVSGAFQSAHDMSEAEINKKIYSESKKALKEGETD